MHITIPPSDNDRNIAAIRRAIENKEKECERARDKLTELNTELRGLKAALDAINPQKTQPRSSDGQSA